MTVLAVIKILCKVWRQIYDDDIIDIDNDIDNDVDVDIDVNIDVDSYAI